MPLTHESRRAVERMLLQMFSLSEMRRLVRFLPGGSGLSAQLPGRYASPADMATAVVDVLDKNGQLDDQFFATVIEERPRRRGEVEAVQAKLVAEPKASPEPVAAEASAPSAAGLSRKLRRDLLQRLKPLTPGQLEELAFEVGLDHVSDPNALPRRRAMQLIKAAEAESVLAELADALGDITPAPGKKPVKQALAAVKDFVASGRAVAVAHAVEDVVTAQGVQSPRAAPAQPDPTLVAPTTGGPPIHVLHLSDFHLRPDIEWDAKRLLDRLTTTVAKEVAAERPIDLIVGTGDLANWGIESEYRLVHSFFKRLLEATGLDSSRLFLVPGNHDVDRSKAKELAIREMDARLRQADTRTLNALLDSSLTKAALSPRYAAYRKFLADLGVAHPHEPTYAHQLEVKGHTLHIAGLDTAWLHTGDGLQGQLVLGERALSNALWHSDEADLTLALAHHPLDWLSPRDRDAVMPLLQSEVHVFLRGHLHKPKWSITQGASGGLVELPAGASYASSKWANAFQVVSLWPEEQKGEVVSWVWSAGEYLWRKDLMASGRGHPTGVWPFSWKRA